MLRNEVYLQNIFPCTLMTNTLTMTFTLNNSNKNHIHITRIKWGKSRLCRLWFDKSRLLSRHCPLYSLYFFVLLFNIIPCALFGFFVVSTVMQPHWWQWSLKFTWSNPNSVLLWLHIFYIQFHLWFRLRFPLMTNSMKVICVLCMIDRLNLSCTFAAKIF